MAYILDSVTLRRPNSIKESNNTQVAVQRALSGDIGRDFFGSNKRTFSLDFVNLKPADYTAIKSIYDSYLSTGTTKVFQSTEANYPVSSVACHVDFQERSFTVQGSSYISDATLVLTEA